MARPELYRLDPAVYPVAHDVPPRFGDMDPLWHLNNAALAKIYEEGRVRFTHDMGVRKALLKRVDHFVIAEVAIHYLAEGRYPDMLNVGSGILHVGGKSFTIAQGLFQNGRCIGVAETVLVYVDGATRTPQPLPEAARAILQDHLLRSDHLLDTAGSERPA